MDSKKIENVVGETKMTVTVQPKGGEEEISEETLKVHVFKTAPAVITVQKGKTMNIGNFESVRVDVGISMPCYAEQVDEAYGLADAWTEERLSAVVEKVNAASKAKAARNKAEF